MTIFFDSMTNVKAELNKQKYIASDEISTIVFWRKSWESRF